MQTPKNTVCLCGGKHQIQSLFLHPDGTAKRRSVKITARETSVTPATSPATSPSSLRTRSGWKQPISWALLPLTSPPWTSSMLVSERRLSKVNRGFQLSFTLPPLLLRLSAELQRVALRQNCHVVKVNLSRCPSRDGFTCSWN